MQYIIVYGSPGGGFNFCGPFQDSDDATQYAEYEFKLEAWWVAELEPLISIKELRERERSQQ